jgi:hypothetical protein
MRKLFSGPNRMALPPPRLSSASAGGRDAHHDVRTLPTALIRRAKVALLAMAVAAAVVLVAVASWPLKLLVVLVFVRGLFASDLMVFRNPPRRVASGSSGHGDAAPA